MALGCWVDADPDAEEYDIRYGHIECARRVGDSVKGGIVGAEAAIAKFNPVSRGCSDNFPFEKRIGGAGCLHGVSNGAAKSGNERCMTTVSLTGVGLEDHRLSLSQFVATTPIPVFTMSNFVSSNIAVASVASLAVFVRGSQGFITVGTCSL